MQTQKFSKIINNGIINLYRGCSHGCIYCDSRSDCYKIKDFENITVKENALEMLKSELKSKKTKTVLRTGSMCDPYIPLENNLKLTHGMLEIIYNQGFGITLITKSARVLSDLELLKKINEKTYACVEMTITTFDDDLCKVLEPNVSLTSERFEALKTLNDSGIETCVWLCPILPYINDDEKNILNIVNKLHEIGTKRIIMFGFGLTLRNGNREYFYKKLDEHFPGLKEKYQKKYGYNYQLESENSGKLWKIFKELCTKYGIIYDYKENFDYIKNKKFNSQTSLFD